MSFVPFPGPPPVAPTNATIKLALEAPGAEKDGPFVRVQLTGQVGAQSLETLRKRALDLWKATNGTVPADLDEAKVLFTYRDVENDLCYIFSDDDLRCALPLFPSALRVFARVELPEKSAAPPVVAADTKSTQTNVPVTTSERSFSDIPVHKVVETLAGVLTAANVALQNHVVSARSSKANNEKVAAETSQPKPVPVPRLNEVDVTEPTPEELLFIHGRHTCDSCLTTPIVGKRFHAVNLPDYDLCSTCKGNYKGDEIEFEEAELDRDRPMQERWYRRFNKWSQKNQKQAEKQAKKDERMAHRASRRNCRGPPQHAPPPHHGPPPHHPFGPPHARGWNKHPRFFGPPPEMCGPPPDQVDQALKEALRRSMLDLKKDTKSNEEENEMNSVEAPVPKEPAAEEAPIPEEPVAKKEAVEAKAPPAEEEFVIPPEAPVGAHPAARSLEEPEEKKIVVEDVAQKESEEDKKPAAADKEDSFTDDAEGNGEVAAALGETMDAIATAINEISAELETELSRGTKTDDAVKKNGEEIAADAGSKAGATILSGEEEETEDIKSDDGSQTSWDVVASDEALARAAQVIGSALFESEVAASQPTSNGDVSLLGSNDSVPTSVPSVASAGSGVAPAQLDRWASQLRQLHELGFKDDAASVEIMERLEAANIGSNETDEVSVEKVINELMKEW